MKPASIIKSKEKPSKGLKIAAKYTPKRRNSKPKTLKIKEDDDDECIILDGDPYNHKVMFDMTAQNVDGDEVVVVGQRGKIACRDYPHARCVCVKFPFNSTPHEKYCHLCYCYVCDSTAPCAHWSRGGPHLNHCDATDKVECWRIAREHFKLNPDNKAVLDTQKNDDQVVVTGQNSNKTARPDIPHARCFCTKFPFDSTPHEKYCNLCYCYVCNSTAPCTHWSQGASYFNHCDATDKAAVWRIARIHFKPELPPVKETTGSLPQHATIRHFTLSSTPSTATSRVSKRS